MSNFKKKVEARMQATGENWRDASKHVRSEVPQPSSAGADDSVILDHSRRLAQLGGAEEPTCRVAVRNRSNSRFVWVGRLPSRFDPSQLLETLSSHPDVLRALGRPWDATEDRFEVMREDVVLPTLPKPIAPIIAQLRLEEIRPMKTAAMALRRRDTQRSAGAIAQVKDAWEVACVTLTIAALVDPAAAFTAALHRREEVLSRTINRNDERNAAIADGRYVPGFNDSTGFVSFSQALRPELDPAIKSFFGAPRRDGYATSHGLPWRTEDPNGLLLRMLTIPDMAMGLDPESPLGMLIAALRTYDAATWVPFFEKQILAPWQTECTEAEAAVDSAYTALSKAMERALVEE